MTEEKKKQKKHENIFTFQIFHKHHETIKEILVAVAALLTIGIMVFAAKQYSILKRTENAPVVQINLPVQLAVEAMPDPPSVDTADWQAYNNPYYGFKLKYPTD